MRFRGFGGGGSSGGASLTADNTFSGSNVFLTGTSGQNPVIFRQTGGVAGTDEIQVYHDGTDGYVVSKSGEYRVVVGGDTIRFTGGGTITTVLASKFIASAAFDAGSGDTSLGPTGLFLAPAGQIFFRATTFGSPFAGLTSPAAGVVASTNGSSGAGWLQNASGTARLTAPVTNVTMTLASLTDLTLTLIAGRKYVGRLVLVVDEGLAADGFKFDLNGGSATMTSVTFGFSSAIGATLGTRTSTALATAITLTALADTSDVILEIPVTLVCNAAGTIIPRQAKNGNVAGATLTLRTGGYFLLDDCPN